MVNQAIIFQPFFDQCDVTGTQFMARRKISLPSFMNNKTGYDWCMIFGANETWSWQKWIRYFKFRRNYRLNVGRKNSDISSARFLKQWSNRELKTSLLFAQLNMCSFWERPLTLVTLLMTIFSLYRLLHSDVQCNVITMHAFFTFKYSGETCKHCRKTYSKLFFGLCLINFRVGDKLRNLVYIYGYRSCVCMYSISNFICLHLSARGVSNKDVSFL
jgi:hypothetical protein